MTKAERMEVFQEVRPYLRALMVFLGAINSPHPTEVCEDLADDSLKALETTLNELPDQ